MKLSKMLTELSGGECLSVVSSILLHNNPMVATHLLILLLGSEGFMAVQLCLELNMNVTTGVINKDAATFVHLFCISFPIAAKETTASGAHKMVNRHTLTRKEVVLLKRASDAWIFGGDGAGSWATNLLSKLTGSALWVGLELGA